VAVELCHGGLMRSRMRRVGFVAAVGGAALALAATGALGAGATRDASFGHNGAVRTSVADDAFAWAVARQSDGKIVTAGQAAPADHTWSEIVVARYSADGVLDSTFGSSGLVTTRVKDYDGAAAVMPQADGKIVVVGHTTKAGGVPALVVVRYQSDGSPDLTFGSAGIDVLPGTSDWNVTAAALDGNGDVVITGAVIVNGFGKLFVVRVLPTGGLDPTFGDNGAVILHLSKPNENDSGNAIAILPQGRIVVAGMARGSCYAVVRLNHDGTLDDTFAKDGKFVGGPNGFASSVAVTSTRQVIAAGTFFPRGGAPDNGAAVLMLNSHGHLISGFGNNGVSRYHSTEDTGAFAAVYRSSDDTFSVLGQVGTQRDPSDLLLLHYAHGPNGWQRDWTTRIDYGAFDLPVAAVAGGGMRLDFAGARGRTLTGDTVLLVGRLKIPR
jgi:uncharacterized delta-60 repeat protein